MESMISRHLHARGRALGLPISGIFELTPRCNFNCKMCYVHLSAEEQKKRGSELTARQWIAAAEQVKDAGTVFLLLTGGEPTLRADFAEIYEKIATLGFSVTINSNGFLMQDGVLELMKRLPPNKIHVTLYGTSNETYERLCGIPAYDRVLTNIRALREAGVTVRVNLSLTPDNVGDMPEVYETAKALGARLQTAGYMFPPRRMWPQRADDAFRLDAERAGREMARLDRIMYDDAAFSALATAAQQGEPTREQEDCEDGQGMTCRAGITSFWLAWDGTLLPCGMLAEPAVADTPTIGFDEAWRQLREKTAQIRLPAACAGCRYERLCHPCAAKCWTETGRFDCKPDYVCRMTHAYLKELEVLHHGNPERICDP